jgi:gas vesicle protein
MFTKEPYTDRMSYFFTGVGLGLGIAVLFAPRSGAAVRQMLRQKAADGQDYLKNHGEAIRHEVEALVDRAGETLERQKEGLAKSVEAGKQAYRASMEAEAVALWPALARGAPTASLKTSAT